MGTPAIVLPLGECPHYAEQFPLIGTILHFSIVRLSTGKGHWLQPIGKVLLQDTTNCHITHVNGDYELSLKVWELQDRGCGQCQLQHIQRLVLQCRSFPLNSSSHQRCQWMRHLTESRYKSPVVRCQSKGSFLHHVHSSVCAIL